MKNEEWKPVVGYEGLYEVSNRGRVRSLDRVVLMRNGYARPLTGRVLKPGTNTSGYLQVGLRKAKTTYNAPIHRLVCEAFHGPAPEGKPWALHRDGDKSRNTPDNLYWGSPKENVADSKAAGTLKNGNVGVTVCKWGHGFTPENTVWMPNGNRKCRACARRRTLEHRSRNLERYRSADREKYRSRGALPIGDPRHGTPNGYNNWKCRCEPCKAAYKDYKKRLRAGREKE